jgi:Zn ribbon nucleic-acid-binding protein
MTLETRASRLWRPNTISSHEDCERLDRALSDLMKEGQRIHDFNERLNHAIEDLVRKNVPQLTTSHKKGGPSMWNYQNSERAVIGIDQWNEKLRCPVCQKTDAASLSLGKNDNMPTVQCAPNGFKVVTTEYGPDFHCDTCNVVVDLSPMS